jgi:two-component system CheB/CheR fusion protein
VKGRQRAADRPAKRPAAERGLAEAAVPFAVPEPTAAASAGDDTPAAIVAIGSAAGGLEALEQFFAAVTVPSRYAFVIVQHFSPDFQSLMVELLARRTPLPVRAVEDGMRPAASAIYLIPPGKTMTIEAGRLRLADPDSREFVQHPIDEFFVSLATDRGPGAIGILLSGSGSDGSRGARAIRASGGRVLVQRPATARFSSMPQAAIEAGCTLEVMAPAAMATVLAAPGPERPADRGDTAAGPELAARLADCLEAAFGIDLAAYRDATVQRRVQRRMMLRGFDQLDAYAAFVADDADEQEALFQDLFIGAPAFCRDHGAIAALERHAVPDLAARLDAGEPVRIWVPACATGEEAYAIAILVLARCAKPAESLELSVTATDLHHRSLAVAAAGFYSEEAVAGLPADWLECFFTRRGSGHQVIPALQRIVGFAPHDLLRDPPPTGMHLVSCRKLLVHLRPDAQNRLLASLAAALEPGGHLLLGVEETVPAGDGRFATVDEPARLFRRRAATPERAGLAAAAPAPPARRLAVATGAPRSRERRDQRLTTVQELLLDRYVPPSLLVDEAGQVVHSFGDAGAWLAPASGRASLDLLNMVAEPLRAPLAGAITEVRRTGRPLTLTGLPLGHGDAVLQRLLVEAPPAGPDGHRSLLVSFDDRPEPVPGHGPDPVLRALIDTAPDAVAVAAGPDHTLTALNPAMRDALAAASATPPAEGDPLDHLLACLLPAGSERSGAVPASWTTRSGHSLNLTAVPDTDTLIVRLTLPTGGRPA